MRPRHKAAENHRLAVRAAPVELLASMRPRHKAAENSSRFADSASAVSPLQ